MSLNALENEIKPKNRNLIMNSYSRNIVFLILAFLPTYFLFSQENQEKNIDERWKQIEERINYGSSSKKTGPSDSRTIPPRLEDTPTDNYGSQKTGQPTNEEIKYSRERLYKNSPGGGVNKKIKEDESNKFKDLETPESEAPKFDPPDWDSPDFSNSDGSFWKILLIIIGVLLLSILIYHLFIKNANKKEEKVAPVDYAYDELDPSTLTKSQIEIDLEQAIQQKDFRLAIRIYYTLILKALIEKNWIKWENKKTNLNYLLEMQSRHEKGDFETSVRVFEWVWYGKHEPKEEEFNTVQRFFKSFYNRLKGE